MIKTLPDNLNECNFEYIEDTQFKGAFGCIKSYHIKDTMTDVVAKVCKTSSNLSVLCEAKIMNLLSYHPSFPTFHGLLGDKTLIMESLGHRDLDGNYLVSTILVGHQL